jgi:hypothetical protein
MLTAKNVIEIIQTSEKYLSENFALLDKVGATKDLEERNGYLRQITENQEKIKSCLMENLMPGDEVEDAARMYVERLEHIMDSYEKFGERVNLMVMNMINEFEQEKIKLNKAETEE